MIAAGRAVASRAPARAEPARLEGFDAVTLATGELEATFVPSLGMVGGSLRHGGEELLDRRDGLVAYRETGAVMGLPLLHPWANRLGGDHYELHGRRVLLPVGPPLVRRDDDGLPIHGLLAAHPGWAVTALRARAERAALRAELDFGAFGDLLAAFPFRHRLTIDVVLSPRALRIATTLWATGGTPVPVAFGFHPCLTLPGVARTDWRIGLPARRELGLDAHGLPNGSGRRRFPARFHLGSRSFDDAFVDVEAGARFSLAGGGRAITVTHEAGYPVAQVFSPPGAAFVCFEPMTAPVDALRSGCGLRRVAPAEAFTATFSVTVDPV